MQRGGGLLLLLLLGLALAGIAPIQAQQQQQQQQEQQQPAPLVLPLYRKTAPVGGGAGGGRGGKAMAHLRGQDKAPAASPPPIALTPEEHYLLNFFTLLKFPGGQEAEVLVDTGSAALLIATSDCEKCNQVVVSRDKPEPIRPLVDLKKAGATVVPCGSAACTGVCTTDRIRGLEDVAYCGAGRGLCGLLAENGTKASDDPCIFMDYYGFGDLNSAAYGRVVTSKMEFAGLELNMTWGSICGENLHMMNEHATTGLLGMAPLGCTSYLSCMPSVLDVLNEQMGLPKTFTICGHQEYPVLVLGGTDDRLHEGQVYYTPIMAEPGSLSVGVESAKLGDVPLPVPAGVTGTIDTGTSIVYVPPALMDAFKRELQQPKYCDIVKRLCPTAGDNDTLWNMDKGMGFRLKRADVATLPPLTITLHDGYTLWLQAESGYLWPVKSIDDESAYYAMALGPTDDGSFLLGETLLHRYTVVFDQENHRLGFATAMPDCKKAVGLK